MELAITVLNELVKMCRMGKHLRISNNDGKEVLSVKDYTILFHLAYRTKANFRQFKD